MFSVYNYKIYLHFNLNWSIYLNHRTFNKNDY